MTHPALRPLLLALSIALLPAGAALAGSGLYLDIAGIPGDAIDKGHEAQIDVGSLSWGASVAVSRQSGTSSAAGKPSVQDLFWTQGLDRSVVPLFSRMTLGRPDVDARFEVVKPGAPKPAPYLTLSAERALVSSMSFGGSSGDDTYVAASLNPSAVSLSVDPRALGGTGSVLTTRYDLLKNTTTGPSARAPVPGAGTAPASAGLYLRLGSGSTAIAGDSRAIGYENWIAIDSFSMGTSIALGAGGTATSKPSVSELSWSQLLDATAPAVLFNLLKGQSIGQATIEQVVLNRSGRPVTVMQQALNDVLFSSFSLSGSGGDGAYFAGTMNFASYTQTLWPLLADGSRGGPASIGYDVVNSKVIPGALASNVAGFGNGNLDGSALPVPEPQTWAMLLAGIAGLVGVARRRAQRPAGA